MDKLLLFGGNGLVGSRFIELFSDIFEIKAPSADEVDILNIESVEKIIQEFNPDALINFAAYTNVEEAENQTDDKNGICYQVNVLGAKNVSKVCQDLDKFLIHISTDYVFDGQKDSPYTEEDSPNPINWYGMTKYLAEEEVKKANGRNCIVRISMPYRAKYEIKKDIARFFLSELKKGNEIKAIIDQSTTPTFIDNIAKALSEIVKTQVEGIYHVSAKGKTSAFEFAKTIARTFSLDQSLIKGITLAEYAHSKKAKILKNSALDCSKFDQEFPGILHSIEEDLHSFKQSVDPDKIGVDEGDLN